MSLAEQDNAFTAPLEDDDPNLGTSDERLNSLRWTELKKLYNDSCTVNALIGLWILGVALIAFLLIPLMLSEGVGPGDEIFLTVFVVQLCMALAAIVGCIMRATWGGVFGMILCVLALINFPIGTIIGVLGLIAMGRSFGKLFGANRIPHGEIKAAYKEAKRKR